MSAWFVPEPIDNRPVYRRIGINEMPPATPEPKTMLQEVEEAIEWGKHNRIWAAVVESSQGNG